MLLVNGGRDSIHIQLDSTEIYDPDIGSWRTGAALPRTMIYHEAVNIDNRVLIFGMLR